MSARKLTVWFLGVALAAGAAGWAASTATRRLALQVPPVSSSITVVRGSANVLSAVRALARLESVTYHMERIVDLSDKQSRLFGLLESEDAMLLVAVANITAGVDLQKLQAGDIEVDRKASSVRIRLPASEILSSGLDAESTYVHTRKTGLLARRKEDLESRARAEAERGLVEAARQAGILDAASKNAQRAVESLLRSLEFERIEVLTTTAPKDTNDSAH
ncbi:MAG TPA: DUF4230 domain-containing protein [Polyangiaceae bacterium]